VPPDGESAFAGRLEALGAEVGDRGLRYSLSGPWPAYSFAPALTRNPE
jgi:Gas vesicle synthesis protein GvpL/GvpF